MSEYQFYEFIAIDRPLTEKERKTISSISSRTQASMYGASFLYNYGDFPRDEYQILANYFDAMLYLANWGSTRLMFRFPKHAVNVALLNTFEYDSAVVVNTHEDFIILDMNYNEEEGFGWVNGEGLLSEMLGLRQAIMNGDMRAPYLVWLKAVSADIGYEITTVDDIQAPIVPPNLNKASQELSALIDFFNIEPELVQAAAYFSVDYVSPKLDIEQALNLMPQDEKDSFLMRLAEGIPNLQQVFLKRLRDILPDTNSKPTPNSPTIMAILEKVDAAKEAIEQQKQAELNQYLDSVAARENELWSEIYALISEKKTSAYDKAIEQLVELNKLAQRDNTMQDFNAKIRDIYAKYPTLSGLHSRMKSKGLRKS